MSEMSIILLLCQVFTYVVNGRMHPLPFPKGHPSCRIAETCEIKLSLPVNLARRLKLKPPTRIKFEGPPARGMVFNAGRHRARIEKG
jgi:hypothetical protein